MEDYSPFFAGKHNDIEKSFSKSSLGDNLAFCAFLASILGVAMIISKCNDAKTQPTKQNSSNDHTYSREKDEDLGDVIIVRNGTITRKNNLVSKDKETEDYNVMYRSTKSIVVVAYKDDTYTDFIESNIIITEDNGKYLVDFNEDNLTEENYEEYLSNIQKEKGKQLIKTI